MSRHTIPAADANLTVVIGWDNPLQTFFGQVTRNDAGDEDEPVILWLGGSFADITDPAELIIPLSPYATVTPEHIAQLIADRAAHVGRPPTPTQLANLAVLGKKP